MKESNNNDQLLREFFSENKQEIADNGFSRRVIRHLPTRSHRLAQLWSAFVMLIAVTLFFGLGGLEAIWSTLREGFYTMIQYQAEQLDPQSIIIAALVLLFLGTRKLVSMA